MKVGEATYCKDCEWWELINEDWDIGGWGACHHPVAYANYQIWWNSHPLSREGLAPPSSDGGFEVTGSWKGCPAFRRKGEG